MLRSKWESLKKMCKKEYANYNRSSCNTGSEPPPRKLSHSTVTILRILNIGPKLDDDTAVCGNYL